MLYSFYICQSATQTLILGGYFLFSEADLPFYAVLGASTSLAIQILHLLIYIHAWINIKNFSPNFALYSKNLALSLSIQVVVMMVGVVLCSVFLGMAQRTSNIFYGFPQFSLFMLLSIFQMGYFSVVLTGHYYDLLSDGNYSF